MRLLLPQSADISLVFNADRESRTLTTALSLFRAYISQINHVLFFLMYVFVFCRLERPWVRADGRLGHDRKSWR